MSEPPLSIGAAAEHCEIVLETVANTVVIDDDVLETILTGVLARGHVLIEDVPGTGKTITARTLAGALGLAFTRIQFTPDLLPADITGSHVYDEAAGEFVFNEGPVFANVVLADEINRAPPKTQAALLEAMEEGQVSADGVTHQLPEPFFVIATQNPIEQEGTFELPEAQRDRFMIETSLGYPDFDGERTLLDRRTDRTTPAPPIDRVALPVTVEQLQQVPESVRVDESIKDYVIRLGRATRTHDAVDVGVSPRGIQRLLEASRARAVLRGREYVVPDDVKFVARPVVAHRLVLTTEATVSGRSGDDVVDDVLDSETVPAMERLS